MMTRNHHDLRQMPSKRRRNWLRDLHFLYHLAAFSSSFDVARHRSTALHRIAAAHWVGQSISVIRATFIYAKDKCPFIQNKNNGSGATSIIIRAFIHSPPPLARPDCVPALTVIAVAFFIPSSQISLTFAKRINGQRQCETCTQETAIKEQQTHRSVRTRVERQSLRHWNVLLCANRNCRFSYCRTACNLVS